ncbi:MAG: hypothetical protein M3Q98_09195 [Actinomycetota bacterium]|nr:hypothetical protein [Actinomycetota bacterium]
MQKIDKNDLALPAVSVAIGVAYLIGGIIGDNTEFGIFGLALMTAVGLVMWFVRNRSETVKGLMDHRDERINQMDLKATAVAGSTVIAAVILAFVVDIARGGDGNPYSWLGAVGGVAYVVALLVQRVRG